MGPVNSLLAIAPATLKSDTNRVLTFWVVPPFFELVLRVNSEDG